jgi:hypothetical protein
VISDYNNPGFAGGKHGELEDQNSSSKKPKSSQNFFGERPMIKKNKPTRLMFRLRRGLALVFAVSLYCLLVFPVTGQEFPEFNDFEVKVSNALPKAVRIGNNPDARMFRTRLRQANKEGVNFAGHFIIASWGCGTGCSQGAIIDSLTGKVHFPEELFKGFGISAGHPKAPSPAFGNFEFKPDSRLLILNGWGGSEYGIRFLVWEGDKFRLLRFIPIQLNDDTVNCPPDPYKIADETHRRVLNEWLNKSTGWRLAGLNEYDEYALGISRGSRRENALPYYVSADFNKDSHKDFAVILVGEKGKQKFGLAVFNGPFDTGGPNSPALLSDELQKGDALFFKDRLLIGPYQSDNIFFLIPDGATYRLEMPDMGEN